MVSSARARPEVIPLRPRRQSALALWLVVISGLVLTVASYALLLVFIHDVRMQDRDNAKRDLQQTLSAQLQQAAREFDMVVNLATQNLPLSAIFKTGPEDEEKVVFDAAFWLPLKDISPATAVTLFDNRPQHHGVPMDRVIADILGPFSKMNFGDRQELSIIPLTPHQTLPRLVRIEGRYVRSQANDVAFIRQIEGARAGILVTILSGHKWVPTLWLRQHPGVSYVSILSAETGQPIYTGEQIEKEGDTINHTDLKENGLVFQSALLNMSPKVTLQVDVVGQVKMLAYLPNLVLVFGLMLTAMGAAFVMSNQRQASLAANMNRTLALKNMELNSQVTERERLNQILRKTERENRAIIHAVSDIIFELDKDGRLVFVNDAWQRITGFDSEWAKNRDFFALLDDDHQETYRLDYAALLRGQKQVYRFLSKLRTATDKYRMVEISFSMLRLDDTKNMRVVGTITDIEERRQAELALAEAERKYRTIWENAASGIYQMTPEGHLLSANPSYVRIFGYETAVGMMAAVTNVNRQLYASLKDRQAMIRDVMLSEHIQNIESQGVRSDHTLFWLRESVRVVKDADGNILYFEGSIDDISDQKDAEMKLRAAMTQSDMANRSKTEFLANMSHELRTPLNSIIGFSQIIRDEVLGKLEQRQYWEYARDIFESGRYLLSLINTILDIAKIEAGERELNETLADVGKVMQDAWDMVAAKAQAVAHTIQIQVPDDLPRLVCEEVAIKQILINLLSNAVKFTPNAGHITLGAALDPDGSLRLSITDTGTGMDDEEVARVMTPFGQSTGSFARNSQGPGLGLTLVNSLARLHGGRFELVSKKGVGTNVAVILPASRLMK